MLFKFANHKPNKRAFFSSASEAQVGTLMTIGDGNDIFPNVGVGVFFFSCLFPTSHAHLVRRIPHHMNSLFSLPYRLISDLLEEMNAVLMIKRAVSRNFSQIDLFSLNVLFSHFRPRDVLKAILLWFFRKLFVHKLFHKTTFDWKKLFSRVTSRGQEWENKTYKLKRSIQRPEKLATKSSGTKNNYLEHLREV